MLTLTSTQMNKLDELAQTQGNIPGLILMENAGRESAMAVLSEFTEARSFFLLCGKGNNGGDGFDIMRHLLHAGRAAAAAYAGESSEELKGDAVRHFRMLASYESHLWPGLPRLEADALRQMRHADVIIDCLFGTGLSRPLEGEWAELISCINGLGKPVVSVDIPSGLHADSGIIMGNCVRAVMTVSMACLKKGMTEAAGPEMCGRIRVLDIGIPPALVRQITERGAEGNRT